MCRKTGIVAEKGAEIEDYSLCEVSCYNHLSCNFRMTCLLDLRCAPFLLFLRMILSIFFAFKLLDLGRFDFILLAERKIAKFEVIPLYFVHLQVNRLAIYIYEHI